MKRRLRWAFPLVLVVTALSLAPSASAAVAFDREFGVSSAVFTLDGSGGVFVARNGAVDHYDANGNLLADGFTVASFFTAPNDIARVGTKLYAADGGSDRVVSFDTDGTNPQASGTDERSSVNIPRALAVAGTKVYVSAGETARIARFSTSLVFELNFGWGVNLGSTFEVCTANPPAYCPQNGQYGSDLGKINDARGLVVDAGGNIYAAEQGPLGTPISRIEVFNANPAPVGQIGSQGSAAGQLDRPQGIALDGAGNLFVADQYNHRIAQFLTDGTFVRAFGFGVDTGDPVFETCTTATTCQAGIAGGSPGQLRYPAKVAYNSGHLYVSDAPFAGALRISVFDLNFTAPPDRTLTVTTSGTGSGTVTGAGIDCGGAGHIDCSQTVADGTAIALTATAAGGSTFGGFTGGGCGAASPCTVTMDADKTVDAGFALNPPPPSPSDRTLTVSASGSGSGVVTGTGINCGVGASHLFFNDCTETVAGGTTIRLTATPDAGSNFAGFTGGGCGAASPCTVTMDAAKTVGARFDPPPAPPALILDVRVKGRQQLDKLKLTATCSSACTLAARAKGKIDDDKFKSRETTAVLHPTDPVKLKLEVKEKVLEQLVGESGKAKITVTATDSFSTVSVVKTVKVLHPTDPVRN